MTRLIITAAALIALAGPALAHDTIKVPCWVQSETNPPNWMTDNSYLPDWWKGDGFKVIGHSTDGLGKPVCTIRERR